MILRKDSLIYRMTQLDWFLLLTIVALAAFGVVILFSAGASAGDLGEGPGWARDHAIRFGTFLIIAFIAALVPLKVWAAFAYPAYAVGIILLIGVELAGNVVKGGQRWLDIGPITLQPSEFMKLAVPLCLARFYHQMFAAGRSGIWIHFVALLIIAVPFEFIRRQPDLGTSLMVAGAGLAVIFFAGISLRVVISLAVLVVALTPVAYFFALDDYQRQRVETMFNPEADPRGAGYQLQQGVIAVGSGGLAGKGFMEGTQKELKFIPEQHTDFIFSIVAEEFGFMGSLALLLAWAIAIWQGMTIAGGSRSAFGGLAAAGFVATLALYVFINIGMVIGLLPVVGIPLPLISYGGTVMLTVMVGFGLLMAVHINRTNDMTLRGLY
jgi:rod shape determining protein RodA